MAFQKAISNVGVLTVAGLLLAGASAGRADTIYVDPCAPPGGDGQTWPTAFDDLQDALDAAIWGDDVWVAQGMYLPTDQVDPWDERTVTFQLLDGVAIYGGFPCDGGDWGDRDPETYETTLSGDIATPGDASDNAYHVVTGNGTDETAALDGFTVSDGNANGPSGYNNGGGMYNDSGSSTVANCTFSGNLTGSYGGGMYNDYSSPTVTNCTFSGNSAGTWGWGGGMFNDDWSSPTVTNCTFSGNAANSGGGMFNYAWSSSSTVTNCTFSGNSAFSGGGMYSQDSSPTIANSAFSGNSANYGGGMIDSSGDLTVANCTFSGNSAGDGGGMYLSGSTCIAANCLLWDNSAANGPEFTVLGGSSLTISYSDVEGGLDAIHGEAGITINWGDGMIDADPLFLGGPSGTWTADGAYDPATGQTTFFDAAAGLSDDELVGEFLNPDITQALQSLIVANTATTISVWGDFASLGAEGAAYHVNDYRLTPVSPCLDAADDMAVPPDVADLDGDGDVAERTPLDLDLNPRFADPPPPGGSGVPDPPDYPQIVDMGSYEFPSEDCNGNGILDPCDVDCGTPGGPCDVPGCGESEDCNENGTPDECEQDCNTNGVPDECDPEHTDIGLFVSQLLAESQDPVLVCMFDQNGDETLNGDDIQGFVDRLLAPP